MKSTKYNSKRYRSAKRRRKNARNSDFLFWVSMILLTVFLYKIAFGISTPTSSTSESNDRNVLRVAKSGEVTQEVDETTTVTEEVGYTIPLEIHQINVSCANAYLIRYDNYTIFVDGGQSFAYNRVEKYLSNFDVDSIDCYIATHWHSDHVSNAEKILTNYGSSKTVVYGPSESPSSKFLSNNHHYMQMVHGASFNLGDITITCVGPDSVTQSGAVNNDSLNVLIQYGDFKFLITGDYLEDAAFNMYADLLTDIDVLQMPHHGLKPYCISEDALIVCNPSTILVPAESSKPTSELVAKLDLEANVLDNTSGSIAIVSYGDNNYQIYTNVTSPTDLG